jgi:hypothetical protein
MPFIIVPPFVFSPVSSCVFLFDKSLLDPLEFYTLFSLVYSRLVHKKSTILEGRDDDMTPPDPLAEAHTAYAGEMIEKWLQHFVPVAVILKITPAPIFVLTKWPLLVS